MMIPSYPSLTPPRIALTAAAVLLSALFVLPLDTTQAEGLPDMVGFTSTVVCAPGSHSSCLPGPFTEHLSLDHPSPVVIDVYLTHTGYYETNEQSSFHSSIGEIPNCGPIPPDTPEIYCGQVSGFVSGDLSLTIQHTGGGTQTGSHQQRYEITVCERNLFFPIIIRDTM
jgi:hypothetical protein